ncbi:hypothetical protein HDU98_001320 [Podochytrium sp. JEL0797]|nr:hypothetical protein HDU98_001320 [Podochytrium sp. JEL0797]
MHTPNYHTFASDTEVATLQKSLLDWYHLEKRDLPWRKPPLPSPTPTAQTQRAYEVWVSEIMCQQTRVATVIPYYTTWMAKWPSLESLSKASLDEVHTVWSGLGYYSRGTRMLEASKIIMDKYEGLFPGDAVELEKHVPGIGRYTAGAIASVAFNKPAALVDGNVIRVLSRLRALGLDPKSKTAVDLHWKLADRIVDRTSPGDFNQALMELGAMVCKPQQPCCEACPVRGQCRAYEEVVGFATKGKDAVFGKRVSKKRGLDEEEGVERCETCLPGDVDIEDCAVTRYPAATKKKAAEEKKVLVAIIECESATGSSNFLVQQRPAKGEWWTAVEMETGAVPVTLKKAFKLLADAAGEGKKVVKKARIKAVEKGQPSVSSFFSKGAK